MQKVLSIIINCRMKNVLVWRYILKIFITFIFLFTQRIVLLPNLYQNIVIKNKVYSIKYLVFIVNFRCQASFHHYTIRRRPLEFEPNTCIQQTYCPKKYILNPNQNFVQTNLTQKKNYYVEHAIFPHSGTPLRGQTK